MGDPRKSNSGDAVTFDQPPSDAGHDAAQDEALVHDLIHEVQQLARLACKGVPSHLRADMESAAMVGLMEALRHFEDMDPDHFRRYLQVRVRGAIRDEARHFDPLSRTERLLVRQVERVTEEYRKVRGRAPDTHELALELKCDEDDCWNALELSEFAISPIDDETLSNSMLTPEDAFANSYSAAALRWALAQLDKRERLVLRLAYKRGMSLSAIAKRLNLSAPRAYQIRVEAERNLAHLVRNSPALKQLSGTHAKFDWDDYTADTMESAKKKA
jgi:RNA polymerase sigma factor for flagellar operon FliA